MSALYYDYWTPAAIWTLREMTGMSATRLAQLVGVSSSTVHNWEAACRPSNVDRNPHEPLSLREDQTQALFVVACRAGFVPALAIAQARDLWMFDGFVLEQEPELCVRKTSGRPHRAKQDARRAEVMAHILKHHPQEEAITPPPGYAHRLDIPGGPKEFDTRLSPAEYIAQETIRVLEYQASQPPVDAVHRALVAQDIPQGAGTTHYSTFLLSSSRCLRVSRAAFELRHIDQSIDDGLEDTDIRDIVTVFERRVEARAALHATLKYRRAPVQRGSILHPIEELMVSTAPWLSWAGVPGVPTAVARITPWAQVEVKHTNRGILRFALWVNGVSLPEARTRMKATRGQSLTSQTKALLDLVRSEVLTHPVICPEGLAQDRIAVERLRTALATFE